MLDGCKPASPPSSLTHCGIGPFKRIPVLALLKFTTYSALVNVSKYSGFKYSAVGCGPGITPMVQLFVSFGVYSPGKDSTEQI